MTRKETLADGVDLYLGDCREILPTLSRFDACVTDPPYLLTSGGNTTTARRVGGWLGDYGNTGVVVKCDIQWFDVLRLVFLSLKDDADAYIMANDKNVNLMWNAAIEAGFSIHNLLVWDKGTAVMNRWYMKNCEFILYVWRGKARTIRDPSSKQICAVPNRQDQAHPTVKPIELMAHYIGNSTDFGQTIIDPFMGIGSTGSAAVSLGRKFTGIEIEPKYFDIACKRIQVALDSPDMFVEPPKPAKQEAFL